MGKAPVCRNNLLSEQFDTDLFVPSAILAARIAGAQSAVIACIQPGRPGDLLAIHGDVVVRPDDLLSWADHHTQSESHHTPTAASPLSKTGFKGIWQISSRSHDRQFYLFLCNKEDWETSAGDTVLLGTLLEQVEKTYNLAFPHLCSEPTHSGKRPLASAGEMLSAILEHNPDRVFVKDSSGSILNCTQAFAIAHGVESKKTLIGKTAWELYPREQARAYFDEEKRIMEGGEPILNRVQKSVDLRGDEVWLSVSKVPIIASDQQITGIIGIARDISQIKRSEMEIAAARDTAMESTKAKSSFLANMSHELRTPLNGIIGMGTLLNSSPLSHDQRDIVDTIHTSAENLLAIINEVLEFSRGEVGKMTLERTEFHPNKVLNSVLDLFTERALSKGIELVAYPLLPDTPFLIGDSGKFRQLLVNLVGNAIKFTEKGFVEIEMVKTKSSSKSGFCFDVSVRDSGIGLVKTSIEKLFDPFTQADGSSSRRFGGTGLGLAICKQIVELMGGEIHGRNRSDGGAEFWFRLEFPRRLSANPTSLPAETGSGRRILALLPESVSSNNLQLLLKRLGYDTVRVGTPAQAKKRISSDRAIGEWDAIMIDSKFKRQTWNLLLEELLGAQSETLPPIVLITNFGERIDPNILKRNGIRSTLARPIKLDRLIATIHDAVHSREFASFSKTVGTEDTAIYRRRHGLGNQRVLVVEENTSNQKILIQLLDRLGFRADPVGSGNEAIESLHKVYYPIILIGCSMSMLSGFDTTRQIRKLENHQFRANSYNVSQIVGMSVDLTDHTLDSCMSSGMNDCICIPVNKEDLKIAMAEAVSRLKHPPQLQTNDELEALNSEIVVS